MILGNLVVRLADKGSCPSLPCLALPGIAALVLNMSLGVNSSSAQTATIEEAGQTSTPEMTVDITGYYLMTNFGADPAFGSISSITGPGIDDFRSNSISEKMTGLEGGGVRAWSRWMWEPSWFIGVGYTGFFTSENSSIGQITTDEDNVHANLLDRTLADNAGGSALNDDFDSGAVDFASENIELEQHFGDLVVGKQINGDGPLSGFWHAGLRVASTDVDRNVTYQNLEFGNDLDTARINFESRMRGIGPTIGGNLSLGLAPGLTLGASASASALYADFNLSRSDIYTDQSIGGTDGTEVRTVSLNTQEIVPVFDASVELKKNVGHYYASVGYTMSAWFGGARSLNLNGYDNNDEENSLYSVKSDNVITHGVYARAGLLFGDGENNQGPTLTDGQPGNTIVEITGYYLMTDFGADPALGSISPITGTNINSDSHSISQKLTDPNGGGVRATARQLFGPSWFTGIEYSGFFTKESSSIGQTDLDNDNIYASLLDRTMASNAFAAIPAGTFEEGVADFASEAINLKQNFGDLVVGQRVNGSGPLRGFWHAGLRVANTDLDREVIYENMELAANPINATAKINFKSDMWGVGPTVGGNLDLAVANGMSLRASASASALYANFDLSRSDTYFNPVVPDTEIRQVSLNTQEIVPVFDASVELEKRFGSFNVSLGYTMSAWLGGARSIDTNGSDDNLADTSSYTIDSNNIITHGIFARGKYLFGDHEVDQGPSLFDGVPTDTIIDITGYYLMADYGADAAYGTVGSVAGVNPDSVSVPLELTDPRGGGIRVSAQQHFASSWFAGLDYTGFFTNETSSIGSTAIGSANDNISANLLDRTLADDANLSDGFANGAPIDFASDNIDLQQHFGDLVVGQNSKGSGSLSSFWHLGMRVANTNLDREVIYQNSAFFNNGIVDTARINFKSDMWGVGPTIGGGLSLSLPQGFALASTASASVLYANFDLSRHDAYFKGTNDITEIRSVSLNTQEIVPVFDASVELKKSFGRFDVRLGYTLSAWLDGARSINANGWDDVEDDTTPYTIQSSNIMTHGMFGRVAMKLGADE